MDVRAPAPLPRSLDPLAGESLSGFLLRLSHHLDLAPGILIRHTGLARKHVATAQRLLMLETPVLKPFARCTKLTEAEAAALTFRPLFGRLPPVTKALTRSGGELRPVSSAANGLLLNSSRYCPACLAGDGSDIQNRHGGPWKLHWRIGMVFACLTHNALLEDACPSCLAPAHGERTAPLVTRQHLAGLHPAQCRSHSGTGRFEVCGQRLDLPGDRLPRPLSEQLAVTQRRILRLLSPEADPRHASASLSDLELTAGMICATWPTAAALAEFELPPGIEAAVAASTKSGGYGIVGTASPPSAVSATVLGIADTLLAKPRAVFRRLLAEILQSVDRRHFSLGSRNTFVLKENCSPLVRHDLQHALVQRFPAHGSLPAAAPIFTGAAAARRGYLPEHIPQRLPGSWARALRSANSPTLRTELWTRHTLPIHLVQGVTGMPFREAAWFLGVPVTWLKPRFARLDLRDNTSAIGNVLLAVTLDLLAEHIAGLDHPADFDKRRQRLAFWSLPQRDWLAITEGLPPLDEIFPSIPTELIGECASAYVWARVTGSSWSLAPCFRPPFTTRDLQIDERSEAHTILSAVHNPVGNGSRGLQAALNDYADSLALRLPDQQ
ncbi:TniQ family protein [Kitasatospora sp. NPDC086791]|uniref:TniQ family protein n=1 Tax=Kitasatospora sp. NPDC086791 TaxID=3155178 RepID=UPI00342B59DB